MNKIKITKMKDIVFCKARKETSRKTTWLGFQVMRRQILVL
jgi:hypothetical protein